MAFDFGDENWGGSARAAGYFPLPSVQPAASPGTTDLGMNNARRLARIVPGFWIKSRAPRRIASTANSRLPHAVITTIGSRPSAA